MGGASGPWIPCESVAKFLLFIEAKICWTRGIGIPIEFPANPLILSFD
jgi:hypothetical protein